MTIRSVDGKFLTQKESEKSQLFIVAMCLEEINKSVQ